MCVNIKQSIVAATFSPFQDIGSPNETVWPNYKELPGVAHCVFPDSPYNQLRKKYMSDLRSEKGLELLNQ